MKRASGLFTLFILLVLLATPAAAAETGPLDLPTAIAIALDHNLNLQLEKLSLKQAELEYQRKTAGNILTSSLHAQQQAEHSLAAARHSYRTAYNNLVRNITQQYTNLFLAGLDLEIKEMRVELENLLLETARVRFQMGDLDGISLLEQENSCNNARFNLETSRDDYAQKKKNFASLLGLKTPVAVAGLAPPPSWEIPEETAIRTALENSTELSLARQELALAESDLERTKISGPPFDIEMKKIALEICRLKKERLEEEIANAAQEAYYQFKQAEKRIALSMERLGEAETKYKIGKEQHAAGLVKPAELLQYEINLKEAEYQYQAAIADYYLKKLALEQVLNLDRGVMVP